MVSPALPRNGVLDAVAGGGLPAMQSCQHRLQLHGVECCCSNGWAHRCVLMRMRPLSPWLHGSAWHLLVPRRGEGFEGRTRRELGSLGEARAAGEAALRALGVFEHACKKIAKPCGPSRQALHKTNTFPLAPALSTPLSAAVAAFSCSLWLAYKSLRGGTVGRT